MRCTVLLCLVLMTLATLGAGNVDNVTRYGRTPAGPNPAAEIEVEHRQSLEFATPHTDWATPYARGTVRVLFFCQCGRWDTLSREGVELMQRFDCRVDAVYGDFRKGQDPGNLWVGGQAGEARMLRLMQQPYDVYLFMYISPRNLPPAAREKLHEAVNGGAGLVLVGTDDKTSSRRRKPDPTTDPEEGVDLTPNTSLTPPDNQRVEIPDWLQDTPGLDIYDFEQGRVVVVPERPAQPYIAGWEAAYDYWQERLGRVVLWAADRAPATVLRVTAPPVVVPDAGTATLSWAGATPGATLEPRVRMADGRAIALAPKTLSDAAGTVTLALPRLPAGTHHLDAILRGPKGVEAWIAAPLTVASPRTVSLALTKDWGEIGESIAGRLTLTGPPLPNERLRLEAQDRRGRILVRRDVPLADAGKPFTIALEPWMPMLLRVTATLTSNGSETSIADAYANVTKRRQDRYNFVMWDCPVGTAAGYAQEALCRGGVTVVLGQGNPRREQAAYDVAWIPYTTYIKNKLNNETITYDGCWNDLAVQTKRIADLAAMHLPARRHGVFVYSLGDEGDVAGSCLHPACLAAYRRFLQRGYGTIAALNVSWGTTFASFDAVTLSAIGKERDIGDLEDDPEADRQQYDNDEQAAFKAGNYPRWYDRVAFQRDNLLQYCLRYRDAYRAMDPKARTGFEGSSGAPFGLGADVEGICREMQFWGPYGSNADELLNALAPRALVRSNWLGYDREPEGLLQVFWRTLTRGSDSNFFWMCAGVGSYHGFIAPDYAPFPETKALLGDTQIVRDGLGDLLLRSTRLDDGIALYYSMPAECAAGIGVGATFGTVKAPGNFSNHAAAQAAWHRIIREQGLQFTYVTDRMLAAAPLDPARMKVLILPRAEAMSDAAAAAIRAYVQAGGTVIADVRPGLYNDHCKRRPAGCLDALFGVTRGEDVTAAPAGLAIAGTVGGRAVTLDWHGGEAAALVDLAVADNGGTACGKAEGTPVCIVRQAGKGRAVLLNFTPGTCCPTKGVVPEALLSFFGSLFAAAGVTSALRLQDAQGKPVRNVEIIRWRNGGQTLAALFRTGGAAETARVVLPAAQAIYDLRKGTRAEAASVPVEIVPNRPTWLALAPKAEPAVQCIAVKTAAPGSVLNVNVSAPGAVGLHALRVRLRTPAGVEADWLPPTLLVGAQPVELPVPIAYNDSPGTWTLEFADLLGMTATVRFTVTP